MRHLDRIVLSDTFEVGGEKIGYCKEIDRYMLAHHRGYAIPYDAYYFLTKERYMYLKEHQKELEGYSATNHQIVTEGLQWGSPDGAGYIRDYLCSINFRSTGHAFFGKPLDGPYLYEGNKLYYHLFSNGKHYAVPPWEPMKNIAARRMGRSRFPEEQKVDYDRFEYDGDEELSFRGFEVADFEGYEDWAKQYLQ